MLQHSHGNVRLISLSCGPLDPVACVSQARKSVGAECNYGIRFDGEADAHKFLGELCVELGTRMAAAGGACDSLRLFEGMFHPSTRLGWFAVVGTHP